MSNKERNVIQILTIISIMFAVCNIPQGIMIILTNNIEHLESNYAFQIFKIVANLLEIANATVNIFVYSVCNRDIRGTYRYFVLLVAQKCTSNKNQNGGKLDDEDVESAEALRKMFPEIFRDPNCQKLSVIKFGGESETRHFRYSGKFLSLHEHCQDFQSISRSRY